MFVGYCLLSFLPILSICKSYASWDSSNSSEELLAVHRLSARLAIDADSCLIMEGSQYCCSKSLACYLGFDLDKVVFFMAADCLFLDAVDGLFMFK